MQLDSHIANDDLFLPDFCAMQMVFVVVIIAQLAAFVITLAPLELPLTERLNNLGMISLYVQWCALVSCTVLCIARRYLKRVSNNIAGIISYLLILLVVAGISELAYWLVYKPAEGASLAWHWQFLVRNLAIAAIISGPILRYFYVQHQWRRKLQVENKARLQALQSRIRPHFLFNSMNTIASLVHAQPDDAEDAVENLADLFRASLANVHELIPLKDELELCRRYLEIEALRLGDRLNIAWETESVPDDALLPPLLIQPLLENAVYHGIEPLTEGGQILITGGLNNKQINLSISNPVTSDSTQQNSNGNKIAQENIRERLDALYGSQGHLDLQQTSDSYIVSITFPYRNQHEDPDRR